MGGLLDKVPPFNCNVDIYPTGSTNTRFVDLQLYASDTGSGLSSYFAKNEVGSFVEYDWTGSSVGTYEFMTHENWMLTLNSGTKRVDVKFKDGRGNESDIVSDYVYYTGGTGS